MALMYDMRAKPARPAPQRKLPGHEGPAWTKAVRKLRKAVLTAVDCASWRDDTPDTVGLGIIETLDKHHSGSLHVLAVVNSILVKASRR